MSKEVVQGSTKLNYVLQNFEDQDSSEQEKSTESEREIEEAETVIWDRQWGRLLSDPDTEKQLGVFSVKVIIFRHKRSRKAPSMRKSLSRLETLG